MAVPLENAAIVARAAMWRTSGDSCMALLLAVSALGSSSDVRGLRARPGVSPNYRIMGLTHRGSFQAPSIRIRRMFRILQVD